MSPHASDLLSAIRSDVKRNLHQYLYQLALCYGPNSGERISQEAKELIAEIFDDFSVVSETPVAQEYWKNQAVSLRQSTT